MPHNAIGSYWGATWLVAQATTITLLAEVTVAGELPLISKVASCVAGAMLGGMVATAKRLAESKPMPMRVEAARFMVNVAMGVLVAAAGSVFLQWLQVCLTRELIFGVTGLCSVSGWMLVEAWQTGSPLVMSSWLKKKQGEQS